MCSCQYSTVADAARQVLAVGRGTLLAKMDIKHAYRNIPVAPEDRFLLGFQWNGRAFIETVLPFGLRSAPFLFTEIADALLCIMRQNGVTCGLHYIDDFLTIGAPGTQECTQNVAIMQSVCEMAGLPIEPSKSVSPASTIVFLGIETRCKVFSDFQRTSLEL